MVTRWNKGFTLIELLTVIAILAIIGAIAMAALATSKTDAHNSAEAGAAKTLNEALMRASIKNDQDVAEAVENGNAATIINVLLSKNYIK